MKEPLRELSGDALHEMRRLRRVLLGLRVWSWLRPSDRQALLWLAFGAGLLGSLGTVAFRLADHALQAIFTGERGDIVATFATLEWWQRLLIPTTGGVLAGIVLLFTRKLHGPKSTDYMEAVVVGDGVAGGLRGRWPGLEELADGDVVAANDLRVLQAEVAAAVFGTGADLPAAVQPLDLFAR